MTAGATPDLLVGLDGDEAAHVLARATRARFPAGAVLFRLGDPADTLYVIERGRISLTLPMQVQGREEDLLVEERLGGQTVGWSALIPPHRFTLKATAQIETEVITLSRTALLELFAENSQTAFQVTLNLASVIGQRLQVFQAMWLRELQRIVDRRSA